MPTNKAYYGVRYADGCNPSDLWVTYFTSSKRVKRLIEEYGKDSFKVEIRKIFSDKQSAINWEEKVLRRLNLKNGSWINTMITKNLFVVDSETMKFYWTDENYRQKQIKSQKETWSDSELRKKHSELMKSKFSDERKIKQSENAKKQWSNQDKEKIAQKISKTRKENHQNYKKPNIKTINYNIEFFDGSSILVTNLREYSKSINAKYPTIRAGAIFNRPVPKHNIKSIIVI